MYYLPSPHDSGVPPIRVPYLANIAYSISGKIKFEDFFKTAFTATTIQRVLSRLRPNHRSVSSQEILAGIVQSWLFFGLASEALERDIRHAEFFEEREDDNCESLIDLRIPAWFSSELENHWGGLKRTLPSEKYEAKKERLHRCLDTAAQSLGISELIGEVGDDEPSYAQVLLSVHMLIHLVGRFMGKSSYLRSSSKLKSTRYLVKRMLDNGWCRKRLNQIDLIPLHYPTLHYMSSIMPPRAHEENHAMCQANSCTVRIPLDRSLHRSSDCTCPLVPSPVDKVLEIIDAGKIPLIRIQSTDSGDVRLEAMAYERHISFTAISHVWADRQFGSSDNSLPRCQTLYLDSMLALLPRQMDHWLLRDHIPARFCKPVPEGSIRPPSRAYEYFWLDTFCIPQAAEHAQLRTKAIDSMNLIYATAAQTLVVDAGLQNFDAGQEPRSLSTTGRASYYAPAEKYLADTLVRVCASNWMGRAWTLQEGVLSGHLVFVLKESLAYLRLLKPSEKTNLFEAHQTPLQKFMTVAEMFFNVGSPGTVNHVDFPTGIERTILPMEDQIRAELFAYAKSVLNVEEYRKYARGEDERAELFKKAHSLLQSRSTTQPEDVPLILINMSGMNGNAVTHDKNTETRMQLLFYALSKVPAELLFDKCTRIMGSKEDAWIPTEIVPCSFDNDYMLELGPEGWTFSERSKGIQLEYYILPASIDWAEDVYFSAPNESGDETTVYRASAHTSTLQPTDDEHKRNWCIVIDGGGRQPRGALFTIVRREPFKLSLHFASSLFLSLVSPSDISNNSITSPTRAATRVPPSTTLLIPSSHTPLTLRFSRPQNPQQYSDRIIVLTGFVFFAYSHLEFRMRSYLLGSFASSPYFLVPYFFLTLGRPAFIEDKITALMHYAWVKTFQPEWTAQTQEERGRWNIWKWFWRASNYQPRIPFMTWNKWFCQLSFSAYFLLGLWMPALAVGTYWWVAFPKGELLGMVIVNTVFKFGYLWCL